MNFIEEQVKQVRKLQEDLNEAHAEIARLKGQPKRPQFRGKKTRSISVSTFLQGLRLQDKRKKRKKEIPIDQHMNVAEKNVCDCGSDTFLSVRTETKVVQGILIKRNNIAYHGRVRRCKTCGKLQYPQFPEASKGLSFDTNIQSLVSQLTFAGRFTRRILHQFFLSFEIDISYSEISVILARNSEKLKPMVHHLRKVGIAKASHTQTDATGSKRRLKNGIVINQYMNILRTTCLSIFTISRRYNADTINKLLTKKGQKKPLVSDDHGANNACRCGGQQLCLVHEIRLYKKLFPIFTQHQALQTRLLTQWRQLYHLAKEYTHDPPNTAAEELKQKITTLFETITTQVTGYTDLDKQLKLSLKKKHKLLFFLTNPSVPIHNNGCEQDLREYVLIRKISGPTKSIGGDRSIERHLSVIQTIRKQELPVFQTLHGLLTGQLSPSILTVKSV